MSSEPHKLPSLSSLNSGAISLEPYKLPSLSSLNSGAMSSEPHKLPSLSSLNSGVMSKLPSISKKVSSSCFRKKNLDIKPRSGKYIQISDDTLKKSLQILSQVHKVKKACKNTFNIRWIIRLHTMIKNCNCPPDDFIEKIKLLPIKVNQSDEKTYCPYCNSLVENKYCTDVECISYWSMSATTGGFRGKISSLGKKTGWRERLCLLPAILLEICRDTTIQFYPPAKAWAVNQLIEGNKKNWEHIDKLFDGLSCSTNRIPKIKELLNSAYTSITSKDFTDAILYYENYKFD